MACIFSQYCSRFSARSFNRERRARGVTQILCKFSCSVVGEEWSCIAGSDHETPPKAEELGGTYSVQRQPFYTIGNGCWSFCGSRGNIVLILVMLYCQTYTESLPLIICTRQEVHVLISRAKCTNQCLISTTSPFPMITKFPSVNQANISLATSTPNPFLFIYLFLAASRYWHSDLYTERLH